MAQLIQSLSWQPVTYKLHHFAERYDPILFTASFEAVRRSSQGRKNEMRESAVLEGGVFERLPVRITGDKKGHAAAGPLDLSDVAVERALPDHPDSFSAASRENSRAVTGIRNEYDVSCFMLPQGLTDPLHFVSRPGHPCLRVKAGKVALVRFIRVNKSMP